MATRFYLPSAGTAPVSPTIEPIWDYAGSFTRGPLLTTKSDTAFVNVSGSESSGSSSTDVLLKQYISDALPAGDVGGTFSFVIAALESNTAADMFLQVRIYIVSSDGSTNRGVLYPGQTLTSASATATDPNYEFSGGFASRYLSGVSLTTVTATAGDRLVVELGCRAANTSAISRSVQMQFGDPIATADHTLITTELTQKVPWIEFSQNVFAGPQTVSGGQATEADSALTGSLLVGKVVAGGMASETDAALTGSAKAGAVVVGGRASESDVALTGGLVTGQLVVGGQAAESDSAFAGSVTAGAVVVGGRASETDAALTGVLLDTQFITGGRASETDAALTGTVVEPPAGDLIVGGRALESDVARPGRVSGGAATTVTNNRVGGISVGLSMALEFEPVVDAAPARAAKRAIVAATAWSGVTRTGTTYALEDEVTKSKRRLRERVIVGGKDVTYFRGQEVTAKWQLVSPLLYGPGSVVFPKINTAYEVIGEGALSWLDEGKTVRVQLVNDAGEVVETVYKGLITALDSDGQSLTAQTGGEASGRAALQWKPLPVYADPRSSAGKRAFGLVRSLGLDFNPFQGPDTPNQRVTKLGGMYVIDAIELLCRSTQRRDGTQFSVMPGDGGAYRFEAKDTTTVHATVYIDGARVRHALRSDIVDKPNRIYADAVTEDGKRLTGIVAPGIVEGTPQPFGGNMSLGDTGGQVPVLIDRLQGFDLLEVAEGRTGFDEDVEEAVKDLQDQAGLSETGVVNEATWNALFDLDITGYSLRLAHREPAAQQNQVARDRLTPTGAVIRRNPNYRAGIPKVDAHLDMGSGVSFRQRKRWAKAELAGPNESAWSGTLEINTGAVIAGNHHFGDPLTPSDLLDFRLLKPGMNIMARGFQDEAGTLFHISGIDSDGKTLLVDTRARDTLHVWDAVQRRRDEDRWRRGRRASSEQKDVVGEWDGGGGGMLRNSVEVPAGTWTIFGVPAGDEGTISRFKIRTNVNAEMCVAMFGGPLVPKALEQYLARKIETPLTEGGSDAWSDHDINQKLKGNGLLGVWGEHLDPGGYEPRSKSKGGDLTGILADEAGVAYRTAVFPVLYVAVWADRDTTIPAGRIMWNQLEPGA